MCQCLWSINIVRKEWSRSDRPDQRGEGFGENVRSCTIDKSIIFNFASKHRHHFTQAKNLKWPRVQFYQVLETFLSFFVAQIQEAVGGGSFCAFSLVKLFRPTLYICNFIRLCSPNNSYCSKKRKLIDNQRTAMGFPHFAGFYRTEMIVSAKKQDPPF